MQAKNLRLISRLATMESNRMLTKEELKDKALSYLASYRSDMDALQADRAEWLNYYYQDENNYDNPAGRSKVQSSDVHDVIEAVLPNLMDIFYGGNEIVQVRPQGPEDEAAAAAMEKLLNWQFQRQLDGYRILHDWIKDALLQKVAFIKYGWENRTEKKTREYNDINEYELLALQSNPKLTVEITEATEVQAAVTDGFGMVISPSIQTYNVKTTEDVKISKPWVEFCPADEVIFDLYAKDVENMEFVSHRKRVHKSYLAKYGVDTVAVNKMAEDWTANLYDTKFKDLGGTVFFADPNDENYTYIYECYLCDYKKDGTKLHKKVVIYGDAVLEVTENSYKRPPFCAISPMLMPGRLVGRGLAELATEFQDINTALTRSILDNAYYNVLGMRVVNPHRVDVDTFMSGNRPGGIILTKDDTEPSRAIHEIQPTQIPPFIFDMLQYQETKKENKTGVNKYAMGTDQNAINKTATGVAILSNNAQMRTKQIARNMAATGVSDLFNCLAKMNLDYLDDAVAIRLGAEWETIDRSQIDGNYDLIIDTGIGSGNKEIKVQQMLQMIQMSMPLVGMGVVTPLNIQEQLKTIYEAWGYKNSDKYINTELEQQMIQMQMQQQMAQQMMGGIGGLPQGITGQTGADIPPAIGMEGAGIQADPAGAVDIGVQGAIPALSPQSLV